MAARSAEVKAYVIPDTKTQASEVYARWGMSLSDAINIFLVKSIDAGGLPFDMRPEPKPAYNRSTILEADPIFKSSILPSAMDDEKEDLYDGLVR